uniref:Uncharacterized protein LOC111114518 isoform X2 n=1 Tax=Crassostrea virginica TaxID=6565 RepID=A0A8B8C0E0_CRAVI|nr:uncharacterized protein LOC111114518 isoform X2 [Crassostrea virginica]
MGYTWKWKHIVCYFYFSVVLMTNGSADNQRTAEELQNDVKQNKYVLVLFVNGNKESTKAATTAFTQISTPDLYDQDILKVRCGDQTLATSLGVRSYPQLVFYRSQVPALYDGDFATPSIQPWLEQAREVTLQTLDDTSFEHLTQASTGATTGDWLVIFYRESCQEQLPALEGAGVLIKQKTNVAKVKIDDSPETVKRFQIRTCPTTYLFHHSKMYAYISQTSSDVYRVKSLVSFATSWYKNVKGVKVPSIPTAFDKLTEFIADSLKENFDVQIPKGGNLMLKGGAVLAVIAFIVTIVTTMCSRNAMKRAKED